jgi:Protein of unknown function (DUF4231)
MARKSTSYPDWLKAEFGALIDELRLDPIRKRLLKSRWLDQVAWLEGKADRARKAYYRLRLTTVVGAVIIPALVGLDTTSDRLDPGLGITIWAVSLVVAVSAAVEQFFRFGERWRNYRNTVEHLKMEGWLYLQRSGPYSADGASHEALYPSFAGRIEELIRVDVEDYLTKVAVEKERDKGKTEEA